MKRPFMLAVLFLLLLLVIGVYWLVLAVLRQTELEEEPVELVSTDVGVMLPGAEMGIANPLVGQLQGTALDPMLTITDFTLPATTGGDFTLSDYRGKVLLIYFGYLTCPDFCPTTMAKFKQVYEALGADAQQVAVLFVTVDPERDNLELLTRYMTTFNPAFIGLRGEPSQLATIMGQFGAVAIRREVDSAAKYLMDHTTSVFLIDQQGNLMVRFAYEVSSQTILHDVQLVLGVDR